MKLVHWPLTGELLPLVQWGGAPAGPTHRRSVHQWPYCCI